MLLTKIQSNGKRIKSRIYTLEDFRGVEFDQVILVDFNKGPRIGCRAEFIYLLKRGDELWFLRGEVEAREFHQISQVFRELTKPGQDIINIR